MVRDSFSFRRSFGQKHTSSPSREVTNVPVIYIRNRTNIGQPKKRRHTERGEREFRKDGERKVVSLVGRYLAGGVLIAYMRNLGMS